MHDARCKRILIRRRQIRIEFESCASHTFAKSVAGLQCPLALKPLQLPIRGDPWDPSSQRPRGSLAKRTAPDPCLGSFPRAAHSCHSRLRQRFHSTLPAAAERERGLSWRMLTLLLSQGCCSWVDLYPRASMALELQYARIEASRPSIAGASKPLKWPRLKGDSAYQSCVLQWVPLTALSKKWWDGLGCDQRSRATSQHARSPAWFCLRACTPHILRNNDAGLLKRWSHVRGESCVPHGGIGGGRGGNAGGGGGGNGGDGGGNGGEGRDGG